jgi:hypothetical protein
MRFVVLAAVLALSACAQMQWARQDGSAAPQKEVEECEDAARAQVRARPYAYPVVEPVIVQDSFGRMVAAYPPGPFADPYGDRFVEENRLTGACLRARGYELRPK